MKPLIKWIGGKRKFISDIRKYLDEIKYERYYEPFAGSGALFFDIEPTNAVLNDSNKELMNFYKFVQTKPEALFKEIKNLINRNCKRYYDVRHDFNNGMEDATIAQAAKFFFLNKHCFNGIYRVNANGGFNVPVGKSKTIFVPSLDDFKEASKLLEKNTLKSLCWDKALDGVKKNDLVYLDPPYYPDSTSKFTGYTDPKFGIEEHKKMIDKCWELHKMGVKIIISNSNSEDFSDLMKNKFKSNLQKVIFTSNTRSINPKSINRKKSIEILYIIGGEK